MRKTILSWILGSLIGTFAMDMVMFGEFYLYRLPLSANYAVIGSVVGRGVLIGLTLHALMGLFLGIVLGLLVAKVDALKIDSPSKSFGLGLAAGIVTIPFGCVPVAIITGTPVWEFLKFSIIPHLAWGTIMGVVASFGLHGEPRNRLS